MNSLCAYIPDHSNTIKSNFNAIRKQYQEFVNILIKLINGYSKAFYDKNIEEYRAYKKQIDAYIEPKAILDECSTSRLILSNFPRKSS